MNIILSQDEFLSAVGFLIAFIVLVLFLKLIMARNKNARQFPNGDKSISVTTHHRQTQKALGIESTQENILVLPKLEVIPKEEPSWFNRLRSGLNRTHGQLIKNLDEFFLSQKNKHIRDDSLEYLFELLVQADVGVTTSEILVGRVKNRLSGINLDDVERFKGILKEEILLILNTSFENKHGTIENPKHIPHVVLMVGVNGAGKTTTSGKLAFKSYTRNKKVILGAADTFRAAAVEQLAIWAERSHAVLIRLKEGSDPASVAYEATKVANEQKTDICLIDTAGRLQTRQDLMQELSKIARVLGKDNLGAPHEVLLVLDATTGQNALQQAKLFREAVNITGIILTKLDGTAKGGIAIAISYELGLPIRYVGVGESVEDLELFDANEFVSALFHN